MRSIRIYNDDSAGIEDAPQALTAQRSSSAPAKPVRHLSHRRPNRETSMIAANGRVEQIMAIRLPRGFWAGTLVFLFGVVAALLFLVAN